MQAGQDLGHRNWLLLNLLDYNLIKIQFNQKHSNQTYNNSIILLKVNDRHD